MPPRRFRNVTGLPPGPKPAIYSDDVYWDPRRHHWVKPADNNLGFEVLQPVELLSVNGNDGKDGVILMVDETRGVYIRTKDGHSGWMSPPTFISEVLPPGQNSSVSTVRGGNKSTERVVLDEDEGAEDKVEEAIEDDVKKKKPSRPTVGSWVKPHDIDASKFKLGSHVKVYRKKSKRYAVEGYIERTNSDRGVYVVLDDGWKGWMSSNSLAIFSTARSPVYGDVVEEFVVDPVSSTGTWESFGNDVDAFGPGDRVKIADEKNIRFEMEGDVRITDEELGVYVDADDGWKGWLDAESLSKFSIESEDFVKDELDEDEVLEDRTVSDIPTDEKEQEEEIDDRVSFDSSFVEEGWFNPKGDLAEFRDGQTVKLIDNKDKKFDGEGEVLQINNLFGVYVSFSNEKSRLDRS